MTDKNPDWESFGRGIMDLMGWDCMGLDPADVFNLADKHQLIKEIAGGYDPNKHSREYEIYAEKGDPWFEYNFEEKQNEEITN